MLGFLNVYKPAGMTSHDVINRLRRVLKIKKIGHGGTLDPMAEGVLPVAISHATRLIDFLPQEKEYLANFRLGVISKSYDTETELEKFSDKTVTADDINKILENFKGEIKQKPPMYSAVKVGGRKLYELAREGETLDVQERTIVVNKILLNDFDENTQTGSLLINCSKGTYIRSIIHDMGQKLETGGIMLGLVRVKSGGMTVENSVNINDITDITVAEKNLIPVSALLDFNAVNITDKEFEKVRNGNEIQNKNFDGYVFVKYKNETVALGEALDGTIKIRKVFL